MSRTEARTARAPASDPRVTVLDAAELGELVARLRNPTCPASGTVWVGRYELEYVAPRAFASTVELLFGGQIYDVEYLSEPQLVIDGGAWLGLSVLRFRELFPHARILAFEPDPDIFAVLRRNLSRNGVGVGVELVNAALSGTRSPRSFTATGTDGGSLTAAVTGREITVECDVLSDYVAQSTSLVKLNVEGIEDEVIGELGERLAQVDQVLIEYHGFAEFPQSLHRILARLDEAGLTYIVSHFNERNSACVPPLRLDEAFRYFLLVYARRLSTAHLEG